MKKLVLLNLSAFLFWIVASSLSNFDLAFFKYLKSFSSLIITLALVGINLTALIQLFRTQLFSKIEILSIASVLALLIAPLFITLEYTFLGWLFTKLPFINSLIIFILLLIIYYKKKNVNLENFDFLNLNIKKDNILKFIKSPLFFASIICSAAIFIIFSTFYALPELDPYYWYSNFQEMFARGSIMQLFGYRPLFSSLVYIFNQTSEIDFYAVFKYALPFLALLILIPSYLIANSFKSWLQKFLILLLMFINASAFLYSQMPIPQMILNITIFYFTFFLLYSWITQNTLFYFLSGIIILFSYYYHESAALILLIWCAIAILAYGKNLFNFIRNNRLASFLIFFIIVLNFSKFLKGPSSFLTYHFNKIFSFENILKFNFLFPAKYSNIDGNLMGWNDLAGVIKYYIYYVGPVFFIIIAYFLYLFIRNQQFKKYAIKNLAAKELLTLFIAFLCFFSISEILPRIFGIALLPERAWVLGGIFSIVFLFLIFKYQKNNKFLYTLVIISLFINLFGAIYINNLKKYMVTTGNIESAEWIKKNLPENRILFSNSNSGALKLYSQSITVGMPDEFYYSIDAYQENIEQFKYGKIGLNAEYDNLADEMINDVSGLKNYDIKKQKNDINFLLEKNSIVSKKISNLLSLPNNEGKYNLYIYFSKTNKDNPYIDRPYNKNLSQLQDFIFDKYPEKFKRIYFDQANNIIIWQVL